METSLEDLYPQLPGTSELPPPPREQFEKVRQQKGKGYRPHSRHLRGDGRPKYTNRLFLETSPYLLQHAHNPVNWFPWGDEAFELARELGRPVLVSIGYATCHWCHVMEEESFEDEGVATFLNENFVAVKVDREERPDVDAVYMAALHAMGRQGGWPLNVFVTPERRPFYGGTYFPPYDGSRGIGFLSLLKQLREAYRREPERVAQAGVQLAEAVRGMLAPTRKEGALEDVSLEVAVTAYREHFDRQNGGLAGAPKFPSSLPVRLLLRVYRRSSGNELLEMVRLTLQRMAAGGIYDQIGGGFHRYATDAGWQVPHFEKMLYDNAVLAVTYLEGFQVLKEPEFSQVAQEILRYLQREMTSPEGGFYAATDADSLTPGGDKEEGYFFTWTTEEMFTVLGQERAEVVASYYGVTRSGNFEGRSILHRNSLLPERARELNLTDQQLRAIVEESRELLYQARALRPPPFRDEKILCSWNALAISAFARGFLVLGDAAYREQAVHSADFILSRMMKDGRLAHTYQEGEAKGEAFLDDYAFLIAALIDLFEMSGKAHYLERALALTSVVQAEFEDPEAGGFFMTGSRHEELLAREKPAYDGVEPSGNSVMIMNLLRLSLLTEEAAYLEGAKRALGAFSSQLATAPTALSEMLLAVDFLEDSNREIVIVAPHDRLDARRVFLEKLASVFLPNRSLVVVSEGEDLEQVSALVPLLKGKKASGHLAVAYLCEDRTCRLPTSDPEEFARQLKEAVTSCFVSPLKLPEQQ
jgi:uncharacterized protein